MSPIHQNRSIITPFLGVLACLLIIPPIAAHAALTDFREDFEVEEGNGGEKPVQVKKIFDLQGRHVGLCSNAPCLPVPTG